MRRFVFSVLVVSLAGAAFAQNLLGADEVLKRMGMAEKGGLSGAAVWAEMARFSTSMGSLPPAEAGARWVDLAVEAMQVKPSAADPSSPVGDIMKVLPPPESWPAIAQRAEELTKKGKPEMRMLALRMIGHVLTADVSAQWADLKAMQALEDGVQNTEDLELEMAAQHGDLQRTIKILDRRVQAAKTQGSPEFGEGVSMVYVPDLITPFGEAKAREVYAHLLTTSTVEILVQDDAGTTLAGKVAESVLPKIKVPHWSLTASLEGGKLYDGFKKKFPKAKVTSQGNPQGWMVLRAVYAGQGASVLGSVEALRDMSYTLNEQFQGKKGADRAKLMADYLHLALAKRPTALPWDIYQTTSLLSGQGARAIADMRAALNTPKLNAEAIARIRGNLGNTLLGIDKVDEGLAMLRKAAQAKDGGDTGLQIARIGNVLGRPELIQEGIALAKTSPNSTYQVAGLLIELGRYAEAEKLLAENYSSSPDGYSYFSSNVGSTWMRSLVAIYHATGRYDDVVALLDNSPYWGASDITGLGDALFTTDVNYYYGFQPQLGTMIAESLLRTGHRAEADKLVGWLLDRNVGYDPTYALLLEIRGEAALPLLDDLASRNRYQERPLIWKAKLLLDQKKLDEAEATIRKAISIDPSDGETKGGHRMYAYTVLADILAAQGKASDAETMRSAVRAIRLSEKGDDMLAAGLVNRALKLYSDSLKIFSDAYCIQSRMAVQLASEGRYAEAAEHYRRAFELMPDSFGEMETHCFGCEGVFTTGPAEQIAEQVFEELSQKMPNKPQVHYLLGYLREEQGRKAEAYKHFAKAAELDPYYINAWLHMAANASTPAEAKLANVNLMKLDPLSQLSGSAVDVEAVGLAQAYRSAQAALPKPSSRQDLYRLPQSKDTDGSRAESYYYEAKIESPGESVGRASLLQQLTNMLGSVNRFYRRG